MVVHNEQLNKLKHDLMNCKQKKQLNDMKKKNLIKEGWGCSAVANPNGF